MLDVTLQLRKRHDCGAAPWIHAPLAINFHDTTWAVDQLLPCEGAHVCVAQHEWLVVARCLLACRAFFFPLFIAHVLGSLTRGVGRCVSRTFGFESCFLGRFTTKFSVWGCLLTRYYGGGRDSCCRVPVPQYYCAVVPVLQYR